MSTPDADQIKRQIEAYTAEKPHYECYALTLRKVFEKACRVAVPTAIVQSRAKDVSSFAEKCVRKAGKYKDPAHDFTDLCGVRIIVQTLQQVKGVRRYIEANFKILETDDKGVLLKEDKFGYRDVHYIVQLRTDRDLGIPKEDVEKIGLRRAEVQVRTCVQHAWADTLHDRMYKTKLRLSPETKRDSALLAAIMEEGDRNFDKLAGQVDGMLANYTAHADRDDVEKEIAVQQAILANEPRAEKKPALILNLVRLIAGATGNYDLVVKLLAPLADTPEPERHEILLELGHALCKLHQHEPSGAAFHQGQGFLQQTVEHYTHDDLRMVPDEGKRRGILARALSRLGWSHTRVEGGEIAALDCYRRVLECEPANPYYLADILSFEIKYGHLDKLPASTLTVVGQAVQSCRQHALAGIEMPYACLTGGRLNLLLGVPGEALAQYARGIVHCRSEKTSIPCDVLETEIAWLRRVNYSRPMPEAHQWILDLLTLAASRMPACKDQKLPAVTCPAPGLEAPVLVVAGGAVSLDSQGQAIAGSLLKNGLRDFRGTVISGGTRVGIPGCVGDIASELGERKHFRLLGYAPKALPANAPRDSRYDQIVEVGRDEFSAIQILRNWGDILAAGIAPSSVYLVGIGGGPVSADEYHIALALGASVGIVIGTGGSADALISDPLWAGVANLYPLPCDSQTLRAFVIPADKTLHEDELLNMGREFHMRYVQENSVRLPEMLRSWPELPETYKTANIEQARYSVEILRKAGFGVRRSTGVPVIFSGFSDAEVELMAEMEHGRWNIERLLNGWRYSKERDDKRKFHDNLVPWVDLPDGDHGAKKFDRNSVRKFPDILAKAGLEVYRINPHQEGP
jgi:ppGpp synthetase/RelA/SpoT-type nucleotidyltranferase